MKKILCILFALTIALAACKGKDDEPTNLDPATFINTAAQQLDEAETFQFSLKVEGAPVLLDANTIGVDVTLAVKGAEGVVVRPNGLQGAVSISIDDVVAEVDMVVVGKDQYLRHILLTMGAWQSITFSPDFDASHLVTGENSIANAIRALENPQYVGKTSLDGVEMHHITGSLQAERVGSVTVGLIALTEGSIPTELFIRTRDGYLEQIILHEPTANDETIIWQVGLYGYNGTYTVSRPEVD